MTMIGMPRLQGAGMELSIDLALLDNESAVWQMISRLPGMLWIANPGGGLDFVSPQWLQETGYSLDELLGVAWQSLVHQDDRDAVRQQWSVATVHVEPFELDFRFQCAGGDYRWFSMRSRPVFNFDGTTNCWFGLCVDIDDFKRFQEKLNVSERHYAVLFENEINAIAQMHVIYGEQYEPQDVRIDKVNEAYIRITGLAREKVEGKFLSEIFPGIRGSEMDYIDIYGRIARDGGETSFETHFTYLNQWLRVYAYCPQSGECVVIFTDITAQKKAEAALKESEEHLNLIIENLHEGLIVVSPDDRGLHWNRMALELHGYTEQDARMGNLEEIAKDYRLLTREGCSLPLEEWPIPRLMRGESIRDVEVTLKNVRTNWSRILSYGGTLVKDGTGKTLMGVLTIRDVTERRHAEKAHADAERRLQLAVDIAKLGSWECDLAGQTVYFSPQWKRLLGYRPEELTDQITEWSDRLHPDDRDGVMSILERFIAQPIGTLESEFRMQHRDGHYRYMTAQAIADKNSRGETVKIIGTMLDVTEQKLVEQRVREAAQHDPLTGLPNRALIFEYAGHLLAAASRKHSRGALLFIDLDRFKPINDLYGHEIGDRLLKEVAARMMACVRHEDLIGRIGGDEFVIVLPYLSKGYTAPTVAKHVIDALSRPFDIDELSLSISASVGISFYPAQGVDVDTLLHRADLAMYHAKANGRGNYQVFTPELSLRVDKSSSVEARIKAGLLNNHFELHYQPVIDVESGHMVTVEALLRLPVGHGETIGPDRLIPVAESTGMIAQLGDWVIAEVCRQHEAWIVDGLPRMMIAMNISPLQFRQRGFAARLLSIVRNSGIDPHCLQIEVNESTVMERVDDAIETLNQLHAAGMLIALDDLGTGCSNLSAISHLPLDKLKIDHIFVRRLAHDKSSQAITEAIIAMGKSLSLDVVGEGIESRQSLDYMRSHGCSQVQGNWFSRPLPAAAFQRWYRQHLKSGGNAASSRC